MSAVISSQVARLILVRHGEAEGNRELRYLGDNDAMLTERGLAQAEQTAVAVRRFAVEAIYSSPRSRALDTARAIARATRARLDVREELRELSYGVWEGMSRAEVAGRDPELLRLWEADASVTPPGGESLRALSARVIGFANGLAQSHGGQCVALVSHVGPIKALICQVLGLAIEGARRMWLDPATISVVDWPLAPETRGAVRLLNSFTHLDDGVRWLN